MKRQTELERKRGEVMATGSRMSALEHEVVDLSARLGDENARRQEDERSVSRRELVERLKGLYSGVVCAVPSPLLIRSLAFAHPQYSQSPSHFYDLPKNVIK